MVLLLDHGWAQNCPAPGSHRIHLSTILPGQGRKGLSSGERSKFVRYHLYLSEALRRPLFAESARSHVLKALAVLRVTTSVVIAQICTYWLSLSCR